MPSSTLPRMKESAALLLTWSVFALIEGTIRMTANSKPTLDVDYFATETADGTRIMPVVAFLAAGVAEVIFGIAGIFIAFFSLILGHNNPAHTKYFLMMHVVLGSFVFLTFVIVDPIMRAVQATGNALLTQGEQRAVILAGNMLGSITFCYALQGGQFIMGMRLMAAQKGMDDSKAKNKMRAMIWATNAMLSAGSTLFVGGLLFSKEFTSTTAPVGAPPHVVWFPLISIVTGGIMAIYAAIAFVAPSNEAVNKMMPLAWVVTTMAMMVNFSWTFGIVPGLAPPIPGSAQHIGLILSVTILPLFHSLRSHTLLEEQDDGSMTTEDDMEEPLKEAAVYSQGETDDDVEYEKDAEDAEDAKSTADSDQEDEIHV